MLARISQNTISKDCMFVFDSIQKLPRSHCMTVFREIKRINVFFIIMYLGKVPLKQFFIIIVLQNKGAAVVINGNSS